MAQGAEKPGGRRRKVAKPTAKTRRITLTIPAETLDAAAAKVEKGKASSLSAYVSQALADRVATDEQADSFLAFLDSLDEELGAPSTEDYAWARRVASGE